MKMTIHQFKKKETLNQSQFFIFQSTVTLVITKSCSTWSQILFSKLCRISQMKKMETLAFRTTIFLISFLCVLKRICLTNFVIFSHRLLKTLREELLKEESDSCNKRTQAQRNMLMSKRKRKIKTWAIKTEILLKEASIIVMMKISMNSTLMKNLKARQVRRKIWSTTLTNSTAESMS